MIRLGVIGSGFALYGHVPAFSGIRGCRIAAVTATHQDRIKKYCLPLGISNIFKDWRKMLADEKLDAVAIAVTPAAQYAIAKEAMARGLHIFAEKPLADTPSHAAQLVQLAKKYRVSGTVDFIFPEIPAWQKVKKLLDTYRYGRLKELTVNWNFRSFDLVQKKLTWKEDVKAGGGAVAFYFSHVLYYLEFFAGKLKILDSRIIYSRINGKNIETGLDLDCSFPGQVKGKIRFSSDAPGLFRHELTFTCQNGDIRLFNSGSFADNFRVTANRGPDKIDIHLPRDAGNGRIIAVRSLAEKFLKSLHNHEVVHPSLSDGVHIAYLVEQIRKTSP